MISFFFFILLSLKFSTRRVYKPLFTAATSPQAPNKWLVFDDERPNKWLVKLKLKFEKFMNNFLSFEVMNSYIFYKS